MGWSPIYAWISEKGKKMEYLKHQEGKTKTEGSNVKFRMDEFISKVKLELNSTL